MKRAALAGAVLILAATVFAYGNIARENLWPRDGSPAHADLRQLLAQVVKEAPHPLAGKPAPEVKTTALDDGKFDLTEHRGKAIVVLDFWATWCPPCRVSLPVLEKIASDYAKSKTPVVFFAVNQGEGPEAIKRFLEKSGLRLSVLMDQNGDIGEKFSVDSIPQTVVIGTDGTIQAVHVGYSRDLDSQLRTELDALVAGRPLIAPRA